MPLNFDYEFLTNQSVTGTAFVDDSGNLNYVQAVPNDDATFFMPDYRKTISSEIIEQLNANPKVKKVDQYLEANELYLLNAPSPLENAYLSHYENDASLPDSIKKIFNVSSDTRSIQFFGYPEKELKDMEQYVSSGTIHIDKIQSGEEVILMVPIYEFTQKEEYSQKSFLTPEEYEGKENQFKDSYYSVGDTIHFIQLDVEVKIGAIIYQRISWFDTLSVPPMAYALIGANESLQSLSIAPTHSRLRVTLRESIPYQDFEPEIQYYAGLLKGFDFRNNAAEQEEFRELQIILKVLYQTLVGMMALVIIIILMIEERIELFSKRKYYALLRLNGLSLPRLRGLIALKSVYSALCGILLSIPAVYATIQIVFGKMDDIATFINPLEILCSFLLVFVVTLCTSVTSIRYLKKHGITQLMFD